MEAMNGNSIDSSESRINGVVEFLPKSRRKVFSQSEQWESSPIDTGLANITSSDGSSSSTDIGSATVKTEETDSKSTKSTTQKFIAEIMDSEKEDEDDLKSKLKLIKEMLGEDEEIVELEFERAVKHIDNHDNTTMYCPNCSSCITKVLIRKKKVVQPETPELLGCFSCFSLFIPSGDGIKLWPFGGTKTTPTSHQPKTQAPPAKNVVFEGNCFSMFGVFGNGNRKPQFDNNDNDVVSDEKGGTFATSTRPEAEKKHEPCKPQPDSYKNRLYSNVHDGGVGYITQTTRGDVPINIPDTEKINPDNKQSNDQFYENPNQESDDTVIDPSFPPTGEPGEIQVVIPPPPHGTEPTVTIRDSKPVEILKSILYGGLTELIASLSIVSSAAASGATTLNIISIAIANLIGGLIVIFHNLGDLRMDQVARYQEILGRRENFLLHATFVVLSFLLFGIIPPVTYAVTFRTNDDTDLKLAAVAAASLLCIIVLAIGKAYLYNQPRFYVYFKTIMYYIVIAISVSGISYAVGDYINILIGRLGWFETSSAVVPEMKSISQGWATY